MALVLALAFAVIAQPAAAQPDMAIPFMTTPLFYYVHPAQIASLTIIETNQSSLATDGNAAFALSFPEPAAEGGGIAFAPTIVQTSDQNIVAAQTYTFQDFLNTASST